MAEPKTTIVETTTELAKVGENAVTTTSNSVKEIPIDLSFIELAQLSLKKVAVRTTVNMCFKNWYVEKIKEFERAVLLFIADAEHFDEKTETYSILPTAYFMTLDGNVYYKAAYQFVNSLKRVKPGTNFYVKFEGHEKNSNNNMSEMFTVNQYVITE